MNFQAHHIRPDKASVVYIEARALLDELSRIENNPQRGRRRAKEWQVLKEDAVCLLLQCRVHYSVVALVSCLIGHARASAMASNRVAAIHAAAKAEASGAKPSEIHAAYAAMRGKPNTLHPVKEYEPAVIDRNEVIDQRKTRYYRELVESYRP